MGRIGLLASVWDLENVKGMWAGCLSAKVSWAPTLGTDRKETAGLSGAYKPGSSDRSPLEDK